MTIEQTLNRPCTDTEQTVHGPFRFTYLCTMHLLQLRISNSASYLLMCNREVEVDIMLKPQTVEQYYESRKEQKQKSTPLAKAYCATWK